MKSGFARSLVAGLAGFVVYGGWAFYVNVDHGMSMGVRAGLVQGSYSLILTFSTTYLMEWLLTQLKTTGYEIPLTIIATVALLFGTAYTINWIAGTPEILMTILPGWIIGSGYTIAYVVSISKVPSRL